MDVLIGLAAFAVLIFFWKYFLAAIGGAISGAIFGGLFGVEGSVIGSVVGFFGGIQIVRDAQNENNEYNWQNHTDHSTHRHSRSHSHSHSHSAHRNSQQQTESTKTSNGTHNNSNSQIIRCPACKQKIRIRLPIRKTNGRCAGCSAQFSLSKDQSGRVRAEAVESQNSQSNKKPHADSIEHFYNVLGILPTASQKEVRAAYRKKIREYHPDKVQNMGDKIKSFATEETQAINEAYSKIKSTGRTT